MVRGPAGTGAAGGGGRRRPRQQQTAAAAAADVRPLAPPERGFFAKRVDTAASVPVLASSAVPDEALCEAARRIDRQLAAAPALAANLATLGCEVHVLGTDEPCSALPEFRHLDQALDARGRGYGGFFASCGAENLLRLPSDRWPDHRDICTHEFAHTCLTWGLGPAVEARTSARSAPPPAHAQRRPPAAAAAGAAVQEEVESRRRASVARGLWGGCYAATNAQEFFAELTMWYFGSRGDYGTLAPPPREGRDWLREYDPEAEALLDAIWSGRRAPAPLRVVPLRPLPDRDARSGRGECAPVRVLVENGGARALRLLWRDADGAEHVYALVPAGTVAAQDTFAGHVWVLRSCDHDDGAPLGAWAVDEGEVARAGAGAVVVGRIVVAGSKGGASAAKRRRAPAAAAQRRSARTRRGGALHK